jgi:hypothetical protein
MVILPILTCEFLEVPLKNTNEKSQLALEKGVIV